MLTNVGVEQFDNDSFVQAYNKDTRIQKLVDKFDERGVVLAGGEMPASKPEDPEVDQMADRATKNALK
jgi:hypothetical protein